MSPSPNSPTGLAYVDGFIARAITVLMLSFGGVAGVTAAEPSETAVLSEFAQHLPVHADILAVKTSWIEGKRYTFVKYSLDRDRVTVAVFGPQRAPLAERDVPKWPQRVLADSLRQALDRSSNPRALFRVNVALRFDPPEDPGPSEFGAKAQPRTCERAGCRQLP
jgi:hypothetical protein